MKNAEIVDLPEEMIHEESTPFNQRVPLETCIPTRNVLQITGTTQEDLHKQYEAEAESRNEDKPVVEAVAKAERSFEATEEEPTLKSNN